MGGGRSSKEVGGEWRLCNNVKNKNKVKKIYKSSFPEGIEEKLSKP